MEKNKKKKYIVAAAVIAMIILALSFVLIRSYTSSERGLSIEKNTVAWTQDMKSSDENQQIQIPYYGNIYMSSGNRTIDMYLVNPKENNCYFQYVFILNSGEKIYQSDLIKPGRALDKVTLDKTMTQGKYDLNIHVNTYTCDTKKKLNNAVVPAELFVK